MKVKLYTGLIILTFIVLFVIVIPLFYRTNPNEIDLRNIESYPSSAHILGTDALGRDIFSRLYAGGRISLLVGIGATCIKTMIALILGFVAGFSKKADIIIMRIVDLFLCFPFYVLALSVMVFTGNSLFNLIMIMAFLTFAPQTRLIRTEVITLKEKEFIQICKINGAKNINILFNHIIPLLKHTILVIFTNSVAQAVLMESSLSFLGMGIQEPQASWGSMLSVSLNIMNVGEKWFLWLPAGICILLLTYSVHLIGEGLNELFGT